MSKKNRQSHQRTPDIRWKPNVGENHLLQYVSIFFQIRNPFYNGLVLVQSFTSTQAATCRELQLSLVFQSLLEGSYNPLLLFFQGPLFINFQTGSKNIKNPSTTLASSISDFTKANPHTDLQIFPYNFVVVTSDIPRS